MKITPITLNINTNVLKKFQDRLDELNEDEETGKSVQKWLEYEFNQNGEALLEMLLGDY